MKLSLWCCARVCAECEWACIVYVRYGMECRYRCNMCLVLLGLFFSCARRERGRPASSPRERPPIKCPRTLEPLILLLLSALPGITVGKTNRVTVNRETYIHYTGHARERADVRRDETARTLSLVYRSWSKRLSSGGALSSALPVPVVTSTAAVSLYSSSRSASVSIGRSLSW